MSASALRTRPIYGGPFGMTGRYSLATQQCVERGLHSVRFMVIEPRAGAVLSVSADKTDALSSARRLLRVADALARKIDPMDGHQSSLWPEEALPLSREAGAQPKAITRRRREIFDKSDGKCHYCTTALALDGRWHVEHMLPRALDGTDEPANLVAACVECNLAKSDRTALEFMADPTRPPVQKSSSAL